MGPETAKLTVDRPDRPGGLVRIQGCIFGRSKMIKPSHLFCGGGLEFTTEEDRQTYMTSAITALQWVSTAGGAASSVSRFAVAGGSAECRRSGTGVRGPRLPKMLIGLSHLLCEAQYIACVPGKPSSGWAADRTSSHTHETCRAFFALLADDRIGLQTGAGTLFPCGKRR